MTKYSSPASECTFFPMAIEILHERGGDSLQRLTDSE